MRVHSSVQQGLTCEETPSVEKGPVSLTERGGVRPRRPCIRVWSLESVRRVSVSCTALRRIFTPDLS